jgi:Protein of unknown function (DUF4038)/Putative collagen-binding domain of a collagenase
MALALALFCAPLAVGADPAYPLKISANGRYLADQKNAPFLVAGDSPQGLIVDLSESEAEMYFANRRAHGFNTVWINLLCRKGTGGREDGATYDNIAPFTTPNDLATPNEAFFARADRMMELAAKHGLLVMLDPCETIDHVKLMTSNGPDKCRDFGRYLGKRYQRFDNLFWFNGNDFNGWHDRATDAAVQAVALGIKQTDPGHLQTVELEPRVSGSLDDPTWRPIIDVCGSYTYYPTYAQVLKDYNRPNPLPVVMIEADYEFERDSTPATLRRQEYWSNLSGATGQLYGNLYTWTFAKGWKDKIETPGAIQMAYVQALFEPRAWQNLVPDQKHEVVVEGYGTFDGAANDGNLFVQTSDYITAARTPDGRLVLAYVPSRRTIQVNLARLSAPATARWYDPSNGKYSSIEGSPLPNQGQRGFTPPGNNADGDGDWVLVLETAPPPDGTRPDH